eukprot:CAMPEP_0180676632 /NCGR_PEP_ID=MMETSP1037_2-20121125/67423_1 /TAXON_ID=632150 /ORGANISM="Azadinium spinosum, Strain 3D9" /LENGTH=48 /DNA_ID= /DNA_START= /DNA_END= /DNA_ORIENTATION=
MYGDEACHLPREFHEDKQGDEADQGRIHVGESREAVAGRDVDVNADIL